MAVNLVPILPHMVVDLMSTFPYCTSTPTGGGIGAHLFSSLVFLQTGCGLGAHLFLPYFSAHHGSGLILIMNNSPAEMLCVYSERTGIEEGDGEQVFCRLCL